MAQEPCGRGVAPFPLSTNNCTWVYEESSGCYNMKHAPLSGLVIRWLIPHVPRGMGLDGWRTWMQSTQQIGKICLIWSLLQIILFSSSLFTSTGRAMLPRWKKKRIKGYIYIKNYPPGETGAADLNIGPSPRLSIHLSGAVHSLWGWLFFH